MKRRKKRGRQRETTCKRDEERQKRGRASKMTDVERESGGRELEKEGRERRERAPRFLKDIVKLRIDQYKTANQTIRSLNSIKNKRTERLFQRTTEFALGISGNQETDLHSITNPLNKITSGVGLEPISLPTGIQLLNITTFTDEYICNMKDQ